MASRVVQAAQDAGGAPGRNSAPAEAAAQASDDKRRPAGNTFLNARSVGFALIRAWVYLLFLDVTWSFTTSGNISWLPSTYFYSTLALCTTLFLCAAFRTKAATLLAGRAMYFVAPALTAIGSAFILASSVPQAPAQALCLAGGVLTGIGSGLIDLGYGTLYRTEQPRHTTFEVPFAFFLAAGVFALSLMLPDVATGAICALLPLASGAVLLKCISQRELDEVLEAGAGDIAIGPFAWRIGLCACLVGVGDMLVRTACFANSALSSTAFYQLPLVLGSLLTMALIYGCAALAPSGTGIRRVYRYVVFVMAAFYMLLPLMPSASLLEATVALTGYGTFNVLIWLLLAETAFRHRLRGTTIFGIGWGMVTLGVMLGNLAGRFVSAQAPLTAQQLSLVAFLATAAILASYVFVLKDSDLAKMVTPAQDAGGGATALAVPGFEGSEDEGSKPNGGMPDGGPHDAARNDADDGLGDGKTQGGGDMPHRLRFLEACDAVADKFGLTPKEAEVMALYAKGHTSRHIQEELYLSRGTVTTHLRHIYQKLDIHSKQELVALVEQHRVRP